MKLPRYKRTRKVFFKDIPRNPKGKIEKNTLRRTFCSEHLVEEQNRGIHAIIGQNKA